MWMLTVVLLMLITLPAMSSAKEDTWGERMGVREWVTAFLDTSAPHAVPQPLDRLIVKSGRTERMIYQAGPNDINLGEPVVSRDGRRLAFVKVENEATGPKTYLYMMLLAGGELVRLAEMHPPGVTLRGAGRRGTELAWSHNGRTLLFFGQARALGASTKTNWNMQPHELMTIDVAAQTVATVLRRDPALPRLGWTITSQAWAPDDRRIIFTASDEHLIMLDLVTLSETSLGIGTDATWSPDGQWIAARVPKGKNLGDAEYVLIQPNPPYARELLTEAAPRRHIFRFLGGTRTFVGPAIWSPDSRSLVLWQLARAEGEEPYIKDRNSASLERLPERYWIRSLGGRP